MYCYRSWNWLELRHSSHPMNCSEFIRPTLAEICKFSLQNWQEFLEAYISIDLQALFSELAWSAIIRQKVCKRNTFACHQLPLSSVAPDPLGTAPSAAAWHSLWDGHLTQLFRLILCSHTVLPSWAIQNSSLQNESIFCKIRKNIIISLDHVQK